MAVLKMTHSLLRVFQPRALNTFHRHVRFTKQSCAFTVHIVNPLASHVEQIVPASSGPTWVTTFISQVPPKTDASVHASKPAPSVSHQSSEAWLVTNLSIDICLLCGKVHIQLKNINLFPSLVASPKPHDFFFFVHFLRGTNPNVCQALTLKA